MFCRIFSAKVAAQSLGKHGGDVKITGRRPVIQISLWLMSLCVNDLTHCEHDIEVKNQQYGWHDITLCRRFHTFNLRPFALNRRIAKYKE